jgi:hypothetical protein
MHEMAAGRVAAGARNVRPRGADMRQMSARRVAEIGGLNQPEDRVERIGRWELTKSSKKVAGNWTAFCAKS